MWFSWLTCIFSLSMASIVCSIAKLPHYCGVSMSFTWAAHLILCVSSIEITLKIYISARSTCWFNPPLLCTLLGYYLLEYFEGYLLHCKFAETLSWKINFRNICFLSKVNCNHLRQYWRCCIIISAVAYYAMSGLGITAGAHRLWAHRSYKAKLPLRIILAMWNSMAFQVSSHVKPHYCTTRMFWVRLGARPTDIRLFLI